MAIVGGYRAISARSLYLDGRSKDASGSFAFFDTQADDDPISDSALRAVFVDSQNRLSYWNGTSTLRITGGGSGTPTWEDILTGDANLAISSGTFTITQSSDNALITLNKTSSGAGAVIDITNSGSGVDIDGTSSTWSVTAAGAATFVEVILADSKPITLGTGSDATIQWDGSKLAIAGVTDFANNVTFAASATIVQTGVAASTVFTITAGDVVWSDGSLAITDADNAETVTVINNTATTIGASASAAVVQIESTSLTTGALLGLQLTEGTLNGGSYLRAWDATGGAAVFTVAEDGVTTIAGVGGSNALTLTAGDALLSDGSLTITDADNAASLSVTNNTATTANVIAFDGSGVFTGTGSSAFVSIVQSGLTTGTALDVTVAALTSGNGITVTANAATTGSLLVLSSTGTMTTTGALIECVADSATTAAGLVRLTADALTTGFGVLLESTSSTLAAGQLLNIDHTAAADTLVAKTGQLIDIVSSREEQRATGATADDYDVASITRTNINTTAGGTFTAAGAVLYIENVATQTAGTLTDTVNGLEIVMDAQGTGDAINITHNATAGRLLDMTSSADTLDGVVQLTANSVTTGNVVVVDANGLTTGTALELSSTGTLITTGEMLNVVANSATTSTGLVRVSGTGLTDGAALNVTGGGANMTASGDLMLLSMGAATVGNGIDLTTTGVYTGAGVVLLTANSATSGKGIVLSMTGQTSGVGLEITGGGANVTAGGVVCDLIMGAATTGIGLRIATTGVYTGSTGIVDLNAASATTGVIMDFGVAGLTTGTVINVPAADALTTGKILNAVSNSADATARDLAFIHNDHASATAANPLSLRNDGLTGTGSHFVRLIKTSNGTNAITVWLSDATTANGNLSGTAGDLCLNGASNKPEYCTGTTNWTALV